MVGTIVGTWPYMSPEQAQGLPVDRRTDLWSLGVVLYEMVTQRRPFNGATAQQIVFEIVQKPAPAASSAPQGLQRIVGHCLAKDPAQRYQSAAEVVRDLDLDAPPARHVEFHAVDPVTSAAELGHDLLDALPEDQTSIGAALNDSAQELGSTVGVAVVGTIIAALVGTTLPTDIWPAAFTADFTHALQVAFVVLAAITLTIAVIGIRTLTDSKTVEEH
jgi:serine/threonine protein kinase